MQKNKEEMFNELNSKLQNQQNNSTRVIKRERPVQDELEEEEKEYKEHDEEAEY